ncbi:hypothetical protein BH11PSE7_BH11PSE7_08980 [soil metagenome]
MTEPELSAGLIDIVIALTVLEGIALAGYHATTGRGLAARSYALNLASGLCLMLALRGALADAGIIWTALCVTGAGLAHGADIWRRLQA